MGISNNGCIYYLCSCDSKSPFRWLRESYLVTSRGLAALIFICTFLTSLHATEYLYKDEITGNQKFRNDINVLGQELYEKTGIAVRAILLKKLPQGVSIVDYEKEVVKNFNEPTVLLTFSELDQKVDILAKPHSLYQYFDKKQILSPVASWLQAFFMGVFFTHSWDEFKETASDYGGTIIPILAQKAKAPQMAQKYSAAIFNGYADIVSQIAKAKGVELEHDVGDANQKSILFIKVLFYGFILYAIVVYLKIRFKQRRAKKDD